MTEVTGYQYTIFTSVRGQNTPSLVSGSQAESLRFNTLIDTAARFSTPGNLMVALLLVLCGHEISEYALCSIVFTTHKI